MSANTVNNNYSRIGETLQRLLECPVTMEEMENPIIDPHGHTFEKVAIFSKQTVINGENHVYCPINNTWVLASQLYSNQAVKQVAQEIKVFTSELIRLDQSNPQTPQEIIKRYEGKITELTAIHKLDLQRLSELRLEMQQRDARIQGLENSIQERDTKIQELIKAIQERDLLIQQLQNQVIELESKHSQLQNQHETLVAEVKEKNEIFSREIKELKDSIKEENERKQVTQVEIHSMKKTKTGGYEERRMERTIEEEFPWLAPIVSISIVVSGIFMMGLSKQ